MPPRRSAAKTIEYLIACCRIDPDTGCWLSVKSSLKQYGRISSEGRKWLVHRFAYEHLRGHIPDGYEVDHVWDAGCRYKNCWNPDHLEALTRQQHLLRPDSWPTIARTRSHCKNGHKYTPLNTHVTTQGWRICRDCDADRRACKKQQMVGALGVAR